jgi:hypothetical protein
VKRRTPDVRGHPAPDRTADGTQPAGGPGPAAGDQAAAGGSESRPAERDGTGAPGGTQAGPILVLSYAHSGAGQVQEMLAAGTGLACTSSTGIVPLAATAAEAWRRVEGQTGTAMSRLAVSTIRGLLTAQLAVILAGSGKSRWCELVTAPPGAADPFLQVFPQTGFVCVHRSCADVVRAGVQASPWGVYGPALMPYFLSQPGNSVAALAAYWANSTEQLLAFERANAGAAHRLRYEDVRAGPGQALAAVRAALGLGMAASDGAPPEPSEPSGPDAAAPAAPGPAMPAEAIPEPLRERIGHLHGELGYSPPEW